MFKLNARGVITFIVIFIIIIFGGVEGSVEGAEDHLWSIVLAAFMIALGIGYLANISKPEDEEED